MQHALNLFLFALAVLLGAWAGLMLQPQVSKLIGGAV